MWFRRGKFGSYSCSHHTNWRFFSNLHNYVKNFVWDPIQRTYRVAIRAARHLRPKKFGNNKKKIVQSVLRGIV
jgi:hypothetical protein